MNRGRCHVAPTPKGQEEEDTSWDIYTALKTMHELNCQEGLVARILCLFRNVCTKENIMRKSACRISKHVI